MPHTIFLPSRLLCCLVLTFLMLSAVSCKQAGKEEPLKAQASPVSKEYQRGPIRVRLLLDKDTLTIAENLSLTLETDIEDGYEVDLPAFGEKLGEFGILDYREDSPRLIDQGRLLTRKVYRFEPFLSGDYKIAPMTIAFRKKREPQARSEGLPPESGVQDDSERHEIQTEEITVKVQSLLGEDREQLQLKPIFGPVGLPGQPAYVWYIALGIALAGICVCGGFYWYRRKRRAGDAAATAPSAHELAYRQLKELLEENLPECGEYKLFFSRISDVVRYYIENRFGLHAPKHTTEEFLLAISQGSEVQFLPEHRLLLDDFLRHCDLVKFAEHLPTSEEVHKAVEACKAFIEATRAVDSAGIEGRGA